MRLFFARSAPQPAPPPAAPAAEEEWLERWRNLTLKGNLAFEDGQHVRARQLYQEALALADSLLADAALTANPHAVQVAPLLHGITCNNIVELARRQGDKETAGIYLYRRASSLIAIVESEGAPLELRSRCLLHLKVASGGVYEYFEQGGMWEAAAQFSERANAAMFSVQRHEEEAAGEASAPLDALDALESLEQPHLP